MSLATALPQIVAIVSATPPRVQPALGKAFRFDPRIDDGGQGSARAFGLLWRTGTRSGVGNPSLRFAAYAVEILVDYPGKASTLDALAAAASDAEAITDSLADARNWAQSRSGIRSIGGGGGAGSMAYSLEQPLAASGWRLRISVPVEVVVQ